MNPEAIILEIVQAQPGITGIRLGSDAISLVYKKTGSIPVVNWMELIDRMVTRGQIVEVEYVAPPQDYRIKSLYFPAGTSVTVREPA